MLLFSHQQHVPHLCMCSRRKVWHEQKIPCKMKLLQSPVNAPDTKHQYQIWGPAWDLFVWFVESWKLKVVLAESTMVTIHSFWIRFSCLSLLFLLEYASVLLFSSWIRHCSWLNPPCSLDKKFLVYWLYEYPIWLNQALVFLLNNLWLWSDSSMLLTWALWYFSSSMYPGYVI